MKSFTDAINRLSVNEISLIKSVKSDAKGRVTLPFINSNFVLIIVNDNEQIYVVLKEDK